MADSLKEVAPALTVPVPSPYPVSLSHSQPAQRVTSVLLNGKNFHAWSRSFQLYIGGKRKTRWILGKEPKPVESDPKFDEWVSDNCIILGWMFNSMEDRVYHMFMYHDTVHGLWTALTQMYAHARNESRIFELYREISHASQTTLGLSVADYFGYLQTRWEELAQYEPLSDFPSDGAVESKRLDRRHTYQFLMGLKSDFETLRTQILNTSPLPSLYEAFAIGLTYIVSTVISPVTSLTAVFILHPELKQQFSRPRGGGRSGGRGRGTPRTGAIAEVESIPTDLPDFKQLQLQIAQLQSHLGLAPTFPSSGPTAAIVAETPTALHGPDFEEDFGRGYEQDGLYYFGDPLPSTALSSSLHVFSPPGPDFEIFATDNPIPPRSLPILEPSPPTPNDSLPPIDSQNPSPCAHAPLPASSLESGMSSPLVSDPPLLDIPLVAKRLTVRLVGAASDLRRYRLEPLKDVIACEWPQSMSPGPVMASSEVGNAIPTEWERGCHEISTQWRHNRRTTRMAIEGKKERGGKRSTLWWTMELVVAGGNRLWLRV
ncbi:hypothetical protein Acr_10g0006350 [Actinidia rufa]|uniref:Retrotransposon Copia-like N-terminal domain-containing protein n=1 Tax=Actinidia rufa TaxID=165716 RepID=A0A7J0F970_9ERIC|nr:hypothetical protein Acr_10g0006350 [Actinidia rufa]